MSCSNFSYTEKTFFFWKPNWKCSAKGSIFYVMFPRGLQVSFKSNFLSPIFTACTFQSSPPPNEKCFYGPMWFPFIFLWPHFHSRVFSGSISNKKLSRDFVRLAISISNASWGKDKLLPHKLMYAVFKAVRNKLQFEIFLVCETIAAMKLWFTYR